MKRGRTLTCGAAVAVLGAAILGAGAGARSARSSKNIEARAHAIQQHAIVVDTHDDTPQRFYFENFDLGHRDSAGNIDIPRMREGGLGAIFMSIWRAVIPALVPVTLKSMSPR